ncbi:MAG: hypothetical protein IAE94_09645 [Chthoniobacterales bacterium]|nr:hypothetical protein [Chthoniobacterales bacterium]
MNTSLINYLFALPQVVGILAFIGLCLMSKSRRIDWTLFVFVRPFYKSRYIQIWVEEFHFQSAKRGNGFTSPLALAIADAVIAQGYKPLYVFAQADTCKIVTNEASMTLSLSTKAVGALDRFNRYRPVKPFATTLKVVECRMSQQATLLERIIAPFRNVIPV